ncbi:rod shape-determining protein MreC, partial [Brasilonema sp. CT11]|nr:rod shape-determining protein MreC [Brasilonema sp. CT11]
MFTARRWWERRGLQIGLLGIVVGGAWVLRQTQGALMFEIYEGITRPIQMLQTPPAQEERFKGGQFLELQTQITELKNQNKKLKQLLSYLEKEPASSRPIVARVMTRGADNWWQQVTLNRGSLAGIQEGYIVKDDG